MRPLRALVLLVPALVVAASCSSEDDGDGVAPTSAASSTSTAAPSRTAPPTTTAAPTSTAASAIVAAVDTARADPCPLVDEATLTDLGLPSPGQPELDDTSGACLWQGADLRASAGIVPDPELAGLLVQFGSPTPVPTQVAGRSAQRIEIPGACALVVDVVGEDNVFALSSRRPGTGGSGCPESERLVTVALATLEG